MLDIKYIRENAEQIKKAIINKNIYLDLDELLRVDEKRRVTQAKLDDLNAQKNKIAAKSKGGKPSEEDIEEGKNIKEQIGAASEKYKIIEENYLELMVLVPTIPSVDTPIGKDDSGNIEILRVGEPTKFNFTPKDHIELGRDLDIIDTERGVKVAGFRGYYLKNEGASLQMALMLYALNKLIEKGFTPMIPPTLVREFALFGTGYFGTKHYDIEKDEIYKVETRKGEESKFLVGTAEPSLLAYYANETLKEEDLPIKICGFSPCYRSEIGSYGKDTKGIYRVHEFMKVEQVCISNANVDESDRLHQEMIGISKEMHEELGLPYRQLQICTGDMSAGKYKMFDLEAWIPSRDGYGETGSASNFLDWQSRRLNVRYSTKEGSKKHVFMLNNTALPSARVLIAIVENFQQPDGSIVIPEVLQKYMITKEIRAKK